MPDPALGLTAASVYREKTEAQRAPGHPDIKGRTIWIPGLVSPKAQRCFPRAETERRQEATQLRRLLGALAGGTSLSLFEAISSRWGLGSSQATSVPL